VLLLVGSVAGVALALWDAYSLWAASTLQALVLAPLVVAALITVAGRSLGVFLLITAAIPAGLLMLLLDGPASATRPIWLPCLACSLGALVVFHLFVHRLVGRDWPATILGLVLAVLMGFAATVALGPTREQLLWAYGVWQGRREAYRDWRSHDLRLRSASWDDLPYGYCRQALRPSGIGVANRLPCGDYTEELRARDQGYNEEALRLIRERHGNTFLTDLGCGLQRLPDEEPTF
jgi:hypothetical protein